MLFFPLGVWERNKNLKNEIVGAYVHRVAFQIKWKIEKKKQTPTKLRPNETNILTIFPKIRTKNRIENVMKNVFYR